MRRMTALLASLTQSQTPQSLRKNNAAVEVEAAAEEVTTKTIRTREGANTTEAITIEVNSGRTGAGHREDAAASGKTAMTRTGSSTSGVAFKTR